MSDTGLIYVASAAENSGVGTRPWSNASNIVGNNTNDAVYASSAAAAGQLTSYYLLGTFSHGLSASDSIDGIVAAFRRRGATNNVNVESSVRLAKNGTVSGDDKSTGEAFPSTPAYGSNRGGASDTWGLSLSGSDTIGLAVSANFSDKNETVRIHAMRMTIYYTTSPDAYNGGVKKVKTIFIGC